MILNNKLNYNLNTSNNFLNDTYSIISASNFRINTPNFKNNFYAFVQYNDNYRNIENKLILDQLRILTNDAIFINKNSSNASQQIMELLNNSAEIFLALGLDAKEVALNGLTQEQINSLTKDIITFEATKVNGISVLAPKIYLTEETRNRLFNANPLTGSKAFANSSTLFAKENLTID